MRHPPRIGPSFTSGGKGVKAGQVYERGDLIELCHIVEVPFGVLDDYRIAWNDETDCVASGCAMFYNHSNDPSAEFQRRPKSKTIEVRALRRIYSDEEIYIRYACGKWW